MGILASNYFILIVAILIFVSILASRAGYKFGIPVLLLFLIIGMLFGSDGLGIQFYNAESAQFIGMIALSIILFSGGMETDFRAIRPVLGPGLMLSTLGVGLTALFTGLFIYIISQSPHTNIYLPLTVSLLLAATMSSTDSASVFSLLRGQKIGLKHNLREILELESGSNDPMAYMLTIALIQYIQSSALGVGDIALDFIIQFAVGGIIGFGAGWVSVRLINKISIPVPALYPLLLLSLILFTFSATDILHGNGYLAVYIAGIMVGNHSITRKREITRFLDGITMLFQILMFLSLGLLVNPGDMWHLVPVSLLIGLFMIFVARPASVFLSLIPFRKIPVRARLFISWVGLRGAVPIIFATYPVVAGIRYADQIFNIVFIITLLSLIVQGMSIPMVAKALHVDLPYQDGSNEFGVELPDELGADLTEYTLSGDIPPEGKRLLEVKIPEKTLAMLVKRGNQTLVPNGQTRLYSGDTLLLIRKNETDATGTDYSYTTPGQNS